MGDPRPAFTTEVAASYERLMVPLFFTPYARDLASRFADLSDGALLELAAGTGAATRELAALLPAEVSITATDLSPAMLEVAARRGTARPVSWRAADAATLPFGDGAFDAVACQFGVMFFAPRATSFAEVRRVLRADGRFVFNVWGRIQDNDFVRVVVATLAEEFPEDPPGFIERVPHGYHDVDEITADLRAGGFRGEIAAQEVLLDCRAASVRDVAGALLLGTPLGAEVAQRGEGALDRALASMTHALERDFGAIDPVGQMSATVVTASP